MAPDAHGFSPHSDPVTAKKRWIAGGLEALGVIYIDEGAERALISGKSLLPAGVTAIEGTFDRGDAVIVRGVGGHEVARGLSAYAAVDARMIMGKRTSELESLLGFAGRDELIHRDDLVMARR